MRGGVGGGGQRRLNDCEDTVDVAQNIMIPETQNPVPFFFNASRSFQISYALRVLPAIHFDHEPGAPADKIHDERTEQRLTPEVRTAQNNVVPKPMP